MATEIFADVAFYFCAALILGSALGVLFARRVVHAALALLPCLLGIAGLYALLSAHFLFAMQVLVYAGGILVLILFAVLMLQRILGGGILAGSHHLLLGLLGAGAMFVALLLALLTSPVLAGRTFSPPGGVHELGNQLLTSHALAFEAISVVILAALIGALVIARRAPEEEPSS